MQKKPMKMDAYFCPLCDHCERRKEQERQLIRDKLEREEREAKEILLASKREKVATAQKLMNEGVIYGDNYSAYSPEEIRNITNYDFLEKLCQNIVTPGQPKEEADFNRMMLCHETACEQLNVVLLNDME